MLQTLSAAAPWTWTSGLRPMALLGTRCEYPCATRARLKSRLREFGITRVANVTGLDRIGLPVTMVVRPNARSLSVSQGKGLSADAAWVSGVMEAIEIAHAENPRLPLRFASRNELAREGSVLDPTRLAVRPGAIIHDETYLTWTVGTDLFSSQPVYVPYALVHVNAVPPFPSGDEYFHITSNGLASGSTSPEAVIHALCELIERDSLCRWRQLPAVYKTRTLVDLDTVDDANAAATVALCKNAGLQILALDMSSALGLPALICVLLDPHEPADTLRGASMGFGCHLRREIALLRAVTEAAQSRLTLIAGSRDDLNRQDYEVRRRHRDGISWYQALVEAPKPVAFRDLADHPTEDFDLQLAALLQALQRGGIGEAAALSLAAPDDELSVVRVIVPGLAVPDHAH